MANTLAICRKQILALNFKLINSEISLDDYRKTLEAMFQRMGWQKRIQFDNLTFS